MEEGKKCFSNHPKMAMLIIGLTLIIIWSGFAMLRDYLNFNRTMREISFTGQGKVYYEPDIININLGVQVDKKAKAEDALKELNDKIEKVNNALQAAGIPKEDIQTQNYFLSPHYSYSNENGESKQDGYDASQTIAIKIRGIKDNPDKSSQIIKIASEAGINQINSLSFESSDIENIKQKARLEAIADAKDKANQLSGALGIGLGKIVSWWENPYPTSAYYVEYGKGGGGAGTPTVPSGQQEFVIEIHINYQAK